MPDHVTRVTDTWQGLSPVRKGLLTATGAGIVVLLILFYSWSSSTTYVPLYSGLDSADSGQIVGELRSRGVDYQLENGGATVLVPQRDVDELRLDFAAQGLPEGGHVGFEVFSSNAFTATDFVQRLNYQRGLQGELARTIEAFPAVDRARVHIVMPERSLFSDDQAPATASVVLSMRPGQRLGADEVNGVAHLVSGAVEGLDAKEITILNSAGTMIYDGSQADTAHMGAGITATQIGMQRDFERQLESNVQSMLDRTLGPGNSAVSVSATLNFDRIETERESYTTDENGVPRSSSTVTESYTSGGPEDAGQVPGALPNVPDADQNLPGAVLPGGNVETAYERTEVTSNFEVDRTLTREIGAVGGVDRLSLSLLIDESVPPAQAEALQESVAAAAGINAERGDAIVVTQLPFDRSQVDQAAVAFEEAAASERMLTYARMALPVVLLVLGFFFVWLLARSLNRQSVRAFSVYEQPQQLAPAASAGAIGEATSAMRQLPSPHEVRRSELEESVSKMATSNPDTVAEVVQSWLRED